jgi:hypothetical protein
MHRLILPLALSVAIIAPQAHAADCPPEATPEAVFEQGAANGWTIETLAPEAIAAFMDAYNAEEPVSDEKADTVLVGRIAAYPLARVQIFYQGCRVGGYEATPDVIKRMATPPGRAL